MMHALEWKSGGPGLRGTEDYRWECSCGYRPPANYPHLEEDFAAHARLFPAHPEMRSSGWSGTEQPFDLEALA